MFSAYIIQRVPANRRGAAFGSVLAAFDTGIGTGSIVTGLLIGQFGYQMAFLATALLADVAIPYFLIVEKRLNFDVIVTREERTEELRNTKQPGAEPPDCSVTCAMTRRYFFFSWSATAFAAASIAAVSPR